MSTFVIKIIAMITMFCDHLSWTINAEEATFLNYIGRFAFILFCFQLVLGYKKTKSLTKYLLRLLVMAFISQIPYSLLFETIGFDRRLNVIFTLFIGLLTLSMLNFHIDKNKKISFRDDNYTFYKVRTNTEIVILFVKLYLLLLICFFVGGSATTIGYSIEYSSLGILFMISIYLFYPYDNKYNIGKILLYIFSVLLFAFGQSQSWFGRHDLTVPVFISTKGFSKYICIYVFCIIGGLIPLLYNGKKGKDIKWITYFFYPVHIFILYILYLVIH